MTAGFAGAELANLVNEAALLAARKGKDRVEHGRLRAGLRAHPRRAREARPRHAADERRRIAVHEAGHALVSASLPGTDPVHKVTIIGRGNGMGGFTMYRPEEDRFLHTDAWLMHCLAGLLGGTAAEELALGDISDGATSDLQRATADRPPDGQRLRHEPLARPCLLRRRPRRPGRARLERADGPGDRPGGPPTARRGPGDRPRRPPPPRRRPGGPDRAVARSRDDRRRPNCARSSTAIPSRPSLPPPSVGKPRGRIAPRSPGSTHPKAIDPGHRIVPRAKIDGRCDRTTSAVATGAPTDRRRITLRRLTDDSRASPRSPGTPGSRSSRSSAGA